MTETVPTSAVAEALGKMQPGAKKTINGAKIYLPKAGGFTVTIKNVTEHYASVDAAAEAVEARSHPAPAKRTRPNAKSGDPRADRAARERADSRAIREPDEPLVTKPAVKAVKRAAKQDLATRVALALAAMSSDLEGSVVMEGMTRDEARQTLANWIHHLPVRREDWPAELPKPDRSNWK